VGVWGDRHSHLVTNSGRRALRRLVLPRVPEETADPQTHLDPLWVVPFAPRLKPVTSLTRYGGGPSPSSAPTELIDATHELLVAQQVGLIDVASRAPRPRLANVPAISESRAT
jgi:hypothetical protein